MKCDTCGRILRIGDWPFCPHGFAQTRKGFEPYFDIGLGKWVSGMGDIQKAMRPRWENDHYIQIDHRGMPDSYYRELNERRRERAQRDNGFVQ